MYGEREQVFSHHELYTHNTLRLEGILLGFYSWPATQLKYSLISITYNVPDVGGVHKLHRFGLTSHVVDRSQIVRSHGSQHQTLCPDDYSMLRPKH